MKRVIIGWFGLILWAAILSGSADGAAYQAVEVRGGGTIEGKVVLKGPVPEPRAFPLVLYAFGTFCKKISDGEGHVLLMEFTVDDTGGLQDAIVVVQGVLEGKPFPHIRNEFVAINCMFHPADVPESEQFELHDGALVHVHPLVAVMENHQPIYVTNRDPILHNGQIYQSEKGNRVLNFPLPISDKLQGGYIHFEPGKRVMQMICGMHEFMQTWGWMVDNPYYAKTKRGGAFSIEDLPPGTYTVTAWHPHIDPVVRQVTVRPNGRATVNFEFDSRQVIRPLYETQRGFRIPPESNPFEDLEGCEGPFCVRR